MRETYQDYKYTKMRFGKYKGIFIKDIPDEYIKWAVMNVTDQAVATMFSIELQRRYPKYRK